MYALLMLNFICPFVMVLVGWLLKKHPASDMDKSSGYNTPAARRSRERWDYAQKTAPDIFISLGKYAFLAEIIANLIFLIMRCDPLLSVAVGECIGIIFVIAGFFYTDSRIKGKFGDTGEL